MNNFRSTGVNFTNLCSPSKKTPANSAWQKFCCSISPTKFKQHRGTVASSLTSHYRSPRPQWVGQSGQLQSLPISLYRSPIARAKFTNLSLQITPYKEDGKKLGSIQKKLCAQICQNCAPCTKRRLPQKAAYFSSKKV